MREDITLEAKLTTERVKQLQILNRKTSDHYLNIIEADQRAKKRKAMSSTFLQPMAKYAKRFVPGGESSLPTAALTTELPSKLASRSLSKVPDVKPGSIKQKSSRKNSENSEDYWQGQRFTFDGAVEEVRKSYRDSLHQNDYFRPGREYMIKNTELDRRNSVVQGQSARFMQMQASPAKSTYRLPSNVFHRNLNFNDFYAPPSLPKTEEPLNTSLGQQVMVEVESKEESIVVKASVDTVRDSAELYLQYQQSEQAIANMINHFKSAQNPKREDVFVPKRRLSLLAAPQSENREVKVRAKEDNIKYRIYFDLEKSVSDEKEVTEKSFLSLSHMAVRRGTKLNFRGFTGAFHAINKLLARAGSLSKPEYKGLKKREIKRIQELNPITRQATIPLQRTFSNLPKYLTVNSFRTFGNPSLLDKVANFKNPVGKLHNSTVFKAETATSKRVYYSYWLEVAERLLEVADLRFDRQEVGYYSAIKSVVEPGEFKVSQFLEIYRDVDKQSMSTAINFFQKLAKDIELEDEELDVDRVAALRESYKYLNADAHINPFVKNALVIKSAQTQNHISTIAENEAFRDTVNEIGELFVQCPL